MSAKRIIPCLDIRNGKVVKGVHFIDMVDVGDPKQIAQGYAAQGADEVVFLDITATTEGRETMYAWLSQAAEGLTIPLAIGGGIRTVEDFTRVFACGAAKASVNSAAVKNPQLIADASAAFGAARVVAAIDGKTVDGAFHVVINGGQTDTGLDVVDWAKQCEALGAGEILLTSMDADGVQTGYDIPMTQAVVEAVNIPVVASGGCGSVQDIIEVFKQTDCDAALAASLFHFGKATVSEVKKEMEGNGIPCK